MPIANGTKVKIKAPSWKSRPLTGLDAAFEGQTGRIMYLESTSPNMYRVKLDNPVHLESGPVSDDVWSSEFLKTVKVKVVKSSKCPQCGEVHRNGAHELNDTIRKVDYMAENRKSFAATMRTPGNSIS
jgi:hypothetical protein